MGGPCRQTSGILEACEQSCYKGSVYTVPRGPWSMLESGSQEGSDRLAGKLH